MTTECIARQYVEIYQDCTESDVVQVIDAYPNNIVSNDILTLMFARLSDDTFMDLIQDPNLLSSQEFLVKMYQENGSNTHIIKGFGKATGLRSLTKQLIQRRPSTISFYRNDLNKLHYLYRRNKSCHFLHR